MSKSGYKQQNVLRENVIHVAAGFVAKERPHVLAALSTLMPHLGRWDRSQGKSKSPCRTAAATSSGSHCGQPCPAARSSWRSPTTRTSLALSAMQSAN